MRNCLGLQTATGIPPGIAALESIGYLRHRPDLRDQYGAVKLALAADPATDIDTCIARKSPIVQTILAESDLGPAERDEIFGTNNP